MNNKDTLVKLWLKKADHDLKAIENNLTSTKDPLTDICCFHAQQAIEKLIKGAMVFFGKPITKTHDLIYLINQLQDEFPEFNQLKDELEEITHFGVETRYPDFTNDPTLDETKQAQSVAEKVKSIVVAKISF